MPVQVTIIGLGQFGASMGLALGAHKESILRVGHDKKSDVERLALQMGAVDKVEHHLISSIKDSQMVVLAMPVTQVRETLEIIKQDLRDAAIILDVSPIKANVAEMVKEIAPNCYYVGLAPAINPELLHDFTLGLDSARADLFKNATCFVGAAYGTPEEAATLAVDFVRLLGANPILADIFESDGLMATTHIFPQLVSAALLNATLDQPGWQEARKVASRTYSTVTSGVSHFDDVDSLVVSAMQNRVGMTHALDVMIAALQGLRNDIENQNETGIKDRLVSAEKGRKHWWNERLNADWNVLPKVETENMSSFFERFLGTSMFKKKKQG